MRWEGLRGRATNTPDSEVFIINLPVNAATFFSFGAERRRWWRKGYLEHMTRTLSVAVTGCTQKMKCRVESRDRDRRLLFSKRTQQAKCCTYNLPPEASIVLHADIRGVRTKKKPTMCGRLYRIIPVRTQTANMPTKKFIRNKTVTCLAAHDEISTACSLLSG